MQETVTNYLYFTGRTQAVESAEIRARVQGFLESMDFSVAADVEAGEQLFTIEPDVYAARRDQMSAAVAAAEADLSRAESDLERVEKAVETNAVSRQEVELRRSQRDMAKAAVLQAKANLKQAELDLSYCTVTSPIEGQISRNYVDVGNLVGAGEATLLATVAKMDPIHVYFEAGEDAVLRWLDENSRSFEQREMDIPIELGLSGSKDYPFRGVIDYVDNQVNVSTGTIVLRAAVPNPDRKLFPGLFARVRVPQRVPQESLLVKEQAIGTDLGGKYVLTVGEQDVVEIKHVELGALFDGMRVILSGLEPGDRYISEGLLRARPGRPCAPEEESTQPAPKNG